MRIPRKKRHAPIIGMLLMLVLLLLSSVSVASAEFRAQLLFSEVIHIEVERPSRSLAGVKTLAAVETAGSYAALTDMIYDKLYAWDETFTIKMLFDFDENTIANDLSYAVVKALEMNDYISFSVKSYGFRVFLYQDQHGNVVPNNAEIEFTLEYRTTAAEDAAVGRRVDEILTELNVWDAAPRDKILAVHDWIIANVEYDRGTTRYTAYDALFASKTTVCQGYALLGFAMLTELGIETRIIDGIALEERTSHAWNLVKLDGKWLHLDMTHDDPVIQKADGSGYLSEEEKQAYYAELESNPQSSYYGKDVDHTFYLLTNVGLRKADKYRRWSQYCPEVVASLSTLLH